MPLLRSEFEQGTPADYSKDGDVNFQSKRQDHGELSPRSKARIDAKTADWLTELKTGVESRRIPTKRTSVASRSDLAREVDDAKQDLASVQ